METEILEVLNKICDALVGIGLILCGLIIVTMLNKTK